MTRWFVPFLVVTAAALGLLLVWARIRSELGLVPDPNPIVLGPDRHFVSPEMAESSRAQISRAAPEFTAASADGTRFSLAELRRQGPVVLTFIKDGCPCSEAAQPYLNTLHAAYPDATILGVIDVEADLARRWAERYQVVYPILLDPQLTLIRNYEVENSAYVVVIDTQGRIVRHWPGFSGAMFRELSQSIASLNGIAEQPLEFTDAPSELYTGCPYPLEDDTR